jgi:hypothetical protein
MNINRQTTFEMSKVPIEEQSRRFLGGADNRGPEGGTNQGTIDEDLIQFEVIGESSTDHGLAAMAPLGASTSTFKPKENRMRDQAGNKVSSVTDEKEKVETKAAGIMRITDVAGNTTLKSPKSTPVKSKLKLKANRDAVGNEIETGSKLTSKTSEGVVVQANKNGSRAKTKKVSANKISALVDAPAVIDSQMTDENMMRSSQESGAAYLNVSRQEAMSNIDKIINPQPSETSLDWKSSLRAGLEHHEGKHPEPVPDERVKTPPKSADSHLGLATHVMTSDIQGRRGTPPRPSSSGSDRPEDKTPRTKAKQKLQSKLESRHGMKLAPVMGDADDELPTMANGCLPPLAHVPTITPRPDSADSGRSSASSMRTDDSANRPLLGKDTIKKGAKSK